MLNTSAENNKYIITKKTKPTKHFKIKFDKKGNRVQCKKTSVKFHCT